MVVGPRATFFNCLSHHMIVEIQSSIKQCETGEGTASKQMPSNVLASFCFFFSSPMPKCLRPLRTRPTIRNNFWCVAMTHRKRFRYCDYTDTSSRTMQVHARSKVEPSKGNCQHAKRGQHSSKLSLVNLGFRSLHLVGRRMFTFVGHSSKPRAPELGNTRSKWYDE